MNILFLFCVVTAKQPLTTNKVNTVETKRLVVSQSEGLRASHLAVNFAIAVNFLTAVIKFATFFFTGTVKL
jgi:hypothetical protein